MTGEESPGHKDTFSFVSGKNGRFKKMKSYLTQVFQGKRRLFEKGEDLGPRREAELVGEEELLHARLAKHGNALQSASFAQILIEYNLKSCIEGE